MPSDNFYDKWLEQEPKPAPRPRKAQQPGIPPSDDVEEVTQRIEAAGIDITADYGVCVKLGFASRKNTERMAGTTSTVSAASTQATTRPNVTASTTSACGLTAPASPSVPSTSWQRTTESASPFHHYHRNHQYHHSPNP